mmetsp:Transcript_2662/g.7542  ORF Transcript_2662/g.7542 Transcript_2662/m.7542 type:complete len:239 (+) Transcript_2662:4897-5613(+)
MAGVPSPPPPGGPASSGPSWARKLRTLLLERQRVRGRCGPSAGQLSRCSTCSSSSSCAARCQAPCQCPSQPSLPCMGGAPRAVQTSAEKWSSTAEGSAPALSAHLTAGTLGAVGSPPLCGLRSTPASSSSATANSPSTLSRHGAAPRVGTATHPEASVAASTLLRGEAEAAPPGPRRPTPPSAATRAATTSPTRLTSSPQPSSCRATAAVRAAQQVASIARHPPGWYLIALVRDVTIS